MLPRPLLGTGFLASVLVALSSCHSNAPKPPVEHFRVVVPGKVSAGARLNEHGVRWLQQRGVKTILNLERELFEVVPGEVKKERVNVQASGLLFVHLPLHPFAAPTISQLESAVRIIVGADGEVFVHCDHGDDRTGIVIAAYRIKVQGWSTDRAFKEMVDSGFHSSLYFWWKDRLEEFFNLAKPSKAQSFQEQSSQTLLCVGSALRLKRPRRALSRLNNKVLYVIHDRPIPLHGRPRSVFGLFWGFVLPAVRIEPGLARTEHMAVYFARWKDGSFSIVEADDENGAYELLDEFGDEPAELSPLKSCLINFELTDRGSYRVRDFGRGHAR